MADALSKSASSGNSMSVDIDMNDNQLINLADPTLDHHAATKEYVDDTLSFAIEDLNTLVRLDTVTRLNTTVVNPTINVVLLDGYTTVGDWGGSKAYYRQASQPTYGPMAQSQDGTWWLYKGPKIDIRQYGVQPSVTRGAVTTKTTEIRLAYADMSGRKLPLYFPGGFYKYDGMVNTDGEAFCHIESDANYKAHLLGVQAESGTGRWLIRYVPTNVDIEVGTIELDAEVLPRQKLITLTTTTGLEAGMIIHLIEERIWPCDPDNEDLCSEIHKIHRVVDATTIEVQGHTRDEYRVANTTIRAWKPGKVVMKNITLECAAPTTGDSFQCFEFELMANCHIENVTCIGGASVGGFFDRCYDVYSKNCHAERCGFDGGTGYGFRFLGCQNMVIENPSALSCRAGLDFDGASIGGICRDAVIFNPKFMGGGATLENQTTPSDGFFPLSGSVQNRGLSTHGATENIKVIGGDISNVESGLRFRGRDSVAIGVTFTGAMQYPVVFSHGAGLKLFNCDYKRVDFPDKEQVQGPLDTTYQPITFVQIGGSTAASGVDYDAPIIIDGIVADALQESVVEFIDQVAIENFALRNVHVTTYIDTGDTFNILNATGGAVTLRGSVEWGSITINNEGPGTVVRKTTDISPNVTPIAHIGAIDIQEFTASGVWRKPLNCKRVFVEVVGPGGGGGGGARTASGNASSGGGAGGGGAFASGWFDTADLGNTETITIGTGGAGGAGATSDGNAGSDGASGSAASSFGSLLIGNRGALGAGGQLGANSGGGGGAGGLGGGLAASGSTAGSSSSITGRIAGGSGAVGGSGPTSGGGGGGGANAAAGFDGGNSSTLVGGGGGGGSGGGIHATPAVTAGGAGGIVPGATTTPSGGSTAGQAGTNGSNSARGVGSGGGGGASHNAGVGGAGGNGGLGAGGGGGGSAVGGNGGAGGAGGNGFIRVSTYI